jgi:hypothetical protein
MMEKTRKITDVANGRCEIVDIRPTGQWVLIPVTSSDGRAGVIRRELHRASDGRMFVLNHGGFDEVRADALGTWRLVGVRFLDGEWHYGDNGALVPGPAPVKEPPAWVVPGVSELRSKEARSWMSFC